MMTRGRFIRSMGQVGLFLGVLAAVKLYVDTQHVFFSLLAIPAAAAVAVLIAAVGVLLQGDKFVPGTHDAEWDARRVLSLGLVVVFAFGATIARSVGLSAFLYVPMLVIGTFFAVVGFRKTDGSAT